MKDFDYMCVNSVDFFSNNLQLFIEFYDWWLCVYDVLETCI